MRDNQLGGDMIHNTKLLTNNPSSRLLSVVPQTKL